MAIRMIRWVAIVLLLSLSALAEEHAIEIDGIQQHPSVYGRYIVYMQDVGNGKYDIHVYDSGSTTDPSDDVGVVKRITEDGASHNYLNPVIDGRYIAWLDDRFENGRIIGTDVYFFDMGEDEMIGPGESHYKLNAFDSIKGRNYITKRDLRISDGILVWEDFDKYDTGGGDSDIRGYDLKVPGDATNDVNDPHHLLISDEKTQTLFGQTERIDESDPFISGKEVVYASTYLHLFEGFPELFQEIYKKDLSTDTKTPVSDPESGYYYASMPSINPATGQVLWVDYNPPSNVILQNNLVQKQSSSETYYYPLFGNFLTYLYEKDSSYYLSIDGSDINVPDLYSFEYDSDEFRTVIADDDLKEFNPSSYLKKLGSFDSFPEVTQLDDGNFVFTDILGKSITAKISSGFDDEPGQVIYSSEEWEDYDSPSVVSDDAGGAILFWGVRSKNTIFARTLSADNQLGELKLIRQLGGNEFFPWLERVRYGPVGGGAYIIWWEGRDITDGEAYIQFLKKDGTLSSISEIPIGVFMDNPQFTSLEDGTVVACYPEGGEQLSFMFFKDGEIISKNYIIPGTIMGPIILLKPDNDGVVAFISDVDFNIFRSKVLFTSKEGDIEEIDFPNGKIIGVTKDEYGGYYLLYVGSDLVTRDLYVMYLKDRALGDPILLKEDFGIEERIPIISAIDSSRNLIVPFEAWKEPQIHTYIFSWDGKNLKTKEIHLRHESILFNTEKKIFFILIDEYQTFPEIDFFTLEDVLAWKSFPQHPLFLRGDANNDGIRNIADAVNILGYLFLQGDAKPKVSCLDTLDANDDGIINIADAVKLLGHLFSGTGPLPEPFGTAGEDPTDDEIGCDCYGVC